MLNLRPSTPIPGLILLIVIGLCPLPSLGQAVSDNPKEADKFFARGMDFYRGGNFKEAVDSYGQAVKYRPPDAGQLYVMSLAHLQLGKYLEASRLLERSLQLNPTYTASLTVLGALYTYFGRYDEAEKVLKRADSLGAQGAEVFNNLGIAYYRGGRGQDAVGAFTVALKLSPSEAVIHHNLSKAYSRLGLTEEAYEAKRKADRLSPRNISDSGVILLLHDSIKLELQTPNNPPPGTGDMLPYAERGVPSSGGAGSNAASTGVLTARAADSVAMEASGAEGTASGGGVSREKLEPSMDVDDKKLTSIYRVGAGDVLDIKSKGAAPPGSTLYTVLAGGLLEYPPLGAPVAVAGMTTDEIADKLDSELRRRGARAGLTVNTREYVSHTVLVSGLVESRGTKVLRREAVPLYVIIAEAQPLREAGRVILNSYATGRMVEVPLEDIYQEGLLVRPGDVVNVTATGAEFYYISGRVAQAGEKPFRRGITLSQAIVAAGGVLKAGKYCFVSRTGDEGKLVTLRVDLRHLASGVITDPPLQAGDRVEVF